MGATVCKPKNPDCNNCPFNTSCIALDKNLISELPLKEKKLKVKNRYFNYLVLLSDDNKTILNQRKGKGIWQGLYEFYLIESKDSIDEEILKNSDEFQDLKLDNPEVSLFNTDDIIHKLSHQHLHTKFWIIETSRLKSEGVLWTDINEYPVPTLIANFLKAFKH